MDSPSTERGDAKTGEIFNEEGSSGMGSGAKKSSRRHAAADDSSPAECTRKAKNTGADHILTHGDYSPGKVEGDYEVSDGKKD